MNRIFFTLIIITGLASTAKSQVVFSASSKYDADVKVFVCDSKYDADLKIYFSDSKYDAGWRDSAKKQLMY